MDGNPTPAANGLSEMANGVINSVTGKITMTQVASTVGIIIAAGIVSIFAWKFGRKAYAFIKNALSGKNGRV